MSNLFCRTSCFTLLAVAALLLIGGGVHAQGPVTLDNGILKVEIKGDGQSAGTWAAEYADNNLFWTPAEVGMQFAGSQGVELARTFNSDFAIKVRGSESVYTNDPTVVQSIDITAPPYATTTTTGVGPNELWAETQYEVPEGRVPTESFTVKQRITLRDGGPGPAQLKTTSIEVLYEICNTHKDTMRYALQVMVDAQTPTEPSSLFNYLAAADAAPMGTLSQRSDATYNPGAMYSGIHLRDDGFDGELASNESDPKYDFWATIADYDLPAKNQQSVSPPTMFIIGEHNELNQEFLFPGAYNATYTDAALAWYWGWDQGEVPKQSLASDACAKHVVYMSLDQDASIAEPEKPPAPGPDATIELIAGPQTCQDSSFRFNAADSADPEGLITIDRVRWTISNSAGIVEVYPAAGEDDSWVPQNYDITRTFPDAGDYDIDLRIWYTQGGEDRTDTASVTISTVGDPNCPPLVEQPPNEVVAVDDIINFVLGTFDFEGDRLTFEGEGLPAGAKLDLRKGGFYWIVRHDQCGEYPITVTVRDGTNEVDVSWVYVVDCDTESVEATDRDSDGIADNVDNCYLVANRDQSDLDNDGIGDACDGTVDNKARGHDTPYEGYHEATARAECDPATQGDIDGDGVSDPCDDDLDGDGIVQSADDPRVLLDNCPFVSNADQRDSDGDGIGDVCDGTDGEGFANLVEEVRARNCTECLAAEEVPQAHTEPSRVQTADVWMAGLGMVLVIGSIAGTLAIVQMRRR